ncbi:hypothetical protein SmaMPs15_000050 [Stenotrophomonas maltophilia phage vB_SmaM_Ps15]|uniref:Uncharacterized protein n=1 Tax=Stenotrophomonas maltophilia phage vB_SmaM_Ps15 TaxID=3071007 RepID=A0AAE9FMJ3_9CAUD|nr:hypothetical protein PQC01_gp050 [Stenotrophomonas maltophilia phage vB_SmaM_Ps15]UMO77201.1 hypothetical protein SmaMPs15_000050 [Stenotrophomonas maltophilia phage vB_SmaM_Ps15]
MSWEKIQEDGLDDSIVTYWLNARLNPDHQVFISANVFNVTGVCRKHDIQELTREFHTVGYAKREMERIARELGYYKETP